MDIKNIIVKEYLESLTEKNELNHIFPVLLESMGFNILSKPTEFVGLPEYGKDIVAVGIDEDKVKKRFYFELKGGNDRDITNANFYAPDGIHDSIIQASYNQYISAFPEFEQLPLKIVIVHNGVVKGNVQSTVESFFVQMQSNLTGVSFERWDISKLTTLFSEKLFGAYLLTDPKTTRLFNRVLVNLNVTDGIATDYVELLDLLLSKEKWESKATIPRKWKLLFETVKLIGFVVYTESKEYENLEIAKRYLTHLVIKFWHWILKNKLEENKKVTKYFNQVLMLYLRVIGEYFGKTLPVAKIKDGLFSERAGRYEQIGYTKRTMEYLEYLCFFISVNRFVGQGDNDVGLEQQLIQVINSNDVADRPLIDIHSIPIINILKLFIDFGKPQNAKNYLQRVLGTIMYTKDNLGFLPDANNSIENVIKFTTIGVKPVYYSDSTSPLLTVLFEFMAILDMEDEYVAMREFVKKHDIELGIFVPFHGKTSTSIHLIDDKENDLEEQLFSRSFTDGYQSQLTLTKNFSETLEFSEFKEKVKNRRSEFEYDYRTDKAGYSFLKDLAHIYYLTPYFPDKWRSYIAVDQKK
jgi:hypothetical protein